MVSRLPGIIIPQKLCESCIVGKQARIPFQARLEMRSKEQLEVVQSDICGSLEVPTLAGNRYFIIFIDKFSRMVWVYLIKLKSKALEMFKRFMASVERETGRQVKVFRIDGGGEYTSFHFESFCQNCGITHEVIAPYTPQHNGLVERRNKIVMNMARCLLREKTVSRELWGEAVSTAVYVLNRCPMKRLTSKVSHAIWTSMKPFVKHFKIFRSLAFCHIADQKRSKLEDKGEAMVFAGYHPTDAYKLYDPVRGKMSINRYVLVLEDESWD